MTWLGRHCGGQQQVTDVATSGRAPVPGEGGKGLRHPALTQISYPGMTWIHTKGTIGGVAPESAQMRTSADNQEISVVSVAYTFLTSIITGPEVRVLLNPATHIDLPGNLPNATDTGI